MKGGAGACRQLPTGPRWLSAKSTSKPWVQPTELWALSYRHAKKEQIRQQLLKERDRIISKLGNTSVQCFPDTLVINSEQHSSPVLQTQEHNTCAKVSARRPLNQATSQTSVKNLLSSRVCLEWQGDVQKFVLLTIFNTSLTMKSGQDTRKEFSIIF